METNNIRESSWNKVTKYGLPVNPNLPSLGDIRLERSEETSVKRLMCLLAVAAAAYGFSHEQAQKWIVQEELIEELEDNEREFLEYGKGEIITFKTQIEGMWTIAWALGIIKSLDFTKDCPNSFISKLPDLKKMESIELFKSKVSLRKEAEIIKICDFVYCLHWAIRQTEFEGISLPLKIQQYVVLERRRALEWFVSKDNWYDLQLDT